MSVKEQGFTLIELMMALVILVVILSLGLPSFNSVMESSRLRAAANNVTSAIQYARSEALRSRDTVAVCRANAGFDACAFGADWSGGWLAARFDPAGGNNWQTVADVDVIRIWDTVDVVVSGANNGFIFERDGRVVAAGLLELWNADGDSNRCISVNLSGSTSVARDREDINGVLTCN